MKTLILTGLSCIMLAGLYSMLNNRSQVNKLLSFTQPESASLAAEPVVRQEEISIKTIRYTEASLAPVEPLPTENNSIPAIEATDNSDQAPAENTLLQEEPSYTRIDSNWIDYTVFQNETTAEGSVAMQTAEAVPAQKPVTEENSYINTPSLEDEEETINEPALYARRLVMQLNPEPDDSLARFNVPAYVLANSIVHHAGTAIPEKMVINTALPNEEKSKVQYIPSHLVSTRTEAGRESYSYTLLYDRAEKIRQYAVRKGYDTSYAFMIDMGMRSGRKRFFVMDLNTMTIVNRGMVAHGRGSSSFTFNKSYSNTCGSNCTSLGIYKVGAMYKGNYGLSYRLMGLENTNSNAYKRSIILHGLSCIPYEESEYPICQSEGCPSLSPAFLKEISSIISSRHKPILLWIYDPLAESIEEEMVVNY